MEAVQIWLLDFCLDRGCKTLRFRNYLQKGVYDKVKVVLPHFDAVGEPEKASRVALKSFFPGQKRPFSNASRVKISIRMSSPTASLSVKQRILRLLFEHYTMNLAIKKALVLLFILCSVQVSCAQAPGAPTLEALPEPTLTTNIEFKNVNSFIKPISFEIPNDWNLDEGVKTIYVEHSTRGINGPLITVRTHSAYYSRMQILRRQVPSPVEYATEQHRVETEVMTQEARNSSDTDLEVPISRIEINDREAAILYTSSPRKVHYRIYLEFEETEIITIDAYGDVGERSEIITIVNQIARTLKFRTNGSS